MLHLPTALIFSLSMGEAEAPLLLLFCPLLREGQCALSRDTLSDVLLLIQYDWHRKRDKSRSEPVTYPKQVRKTKCRPLVPLGTDEVGGTWGGRGRGGGGGVLRDRLTPRSLL